MREDGVGTQLRSLYKSSAAERGCKSLNNKSWLAIALQQAHWSSRKCERRCHYVCD